MKTQIFLATLAAGFLSIGSAQAENGRRCDADQEQLSGSSFLIAPDGRFCEMSAHDEMAFEAELNAEQAQIEAEAEARRKAAYAHAMAEMRRNAELNGYTPAQAAKMAEQAAAEARLAAENAQKAAYSAGERAKAGSGTARSAAAASGPKPAGGCIGGARAGGPCLPMPQMKNVGGALARTLSP